VLRALPPIIAVDSKILILDTAYPMVKNILKYLELFYGLKTVVVHLPFPTDDDKVVELVTKTLNENPDIVMASFSHIISTPGIILPVKALAQLCRSKNVLTLIDGAHALGQIPIDVKDINADFYLSNGHKWLYTPKGSAFLWVRKTLQVFIYPAIISGLGEGNTDFQKQFSYIGTTDYSAYLCFSEALAFRKVFGEKAIMDYIHNLAMEGGTFLARAWGTEILAPSMTGAMVNVRIPSTNETLISALPKLLLDKYHTWVPFYALQGTNIWYTRVSAQIFNNMSDFEVLAAAVLALLKGD